MTPISWLLLPCEIQKRTSASRGVSFNEAKASIVRRSGRTGECIRALLTDDCYTSNRIRTQFCVFPKNRADRKNACTMKTIILQTLVPFNKILANSVGRKPWIARRGFLFVPFILVSFALSQQLQGATDTPDPGAKPLSNTADGDNALLSITTGLYNSAFGFDALLANADANFNTGVGAGALLSNNASENTATGAGALLSNTTGDENTANGTFALVSNIDGIRNTAIGNRVLFSNNGDSNTAIGADALGANTTGNFNVAIGGSALIDNIAGNSNTALGVGALDNVTGDSNTGLGRLAGNGITTGNNIIVIGSVSGLSTTNGQVDDSCYIDNIVNAGVDAGTAQLLFVDQDGKLGTTALPNTGTLQNPHALSGKVQELQSTVVQQAKAIEMLTAQLKDQAAQIQKVSAQLEVNKPGARVVRNGQ
jgi:hypothetical protein